MRLLLRKIFGRRARAYAELEERYKNLDESYAKLREKKAREMHMLSGQLNREIENHSKDLDEYRASLSDKDKTIEELQQKMDILYEYYDLNAEPSQDIKTQMRKDIRIHDLEIENMELRNQVRMIEEVQRQCHLYTTGQLSSNLERYNLLNPFGSAGNRIGGFQ